MKIQAVQSNISFNGVSRRVQRLSMMKDSLNKGKFLKEDAFVKSYSMLTGTLLGISACGAISVMTGDSKMSVPAVIAGVAGSVLTLLGIKNTLKSQHNSKKETCG